MKLLRLFALVACLGPVVLSAANDRIVDPVDPGRVTVLRGQRHSQAVPRNDRGPADPAIPLRDVTLVLQPAPGLDAFLTGQRTPGSPNYHRWLTPEQFGDRFGLSANDLDKLKAWLQSAGLTVHDVARGRHWIAFSGTAGQIGRALHTEFHRYEVKGELHMANSTDPSVPAALAGVIAGFQGLDDIPAQPMHVLATPDYNVSGSHYLAPDDFAAIYNVKPLYAAGFDGTGINIAVIGESDIKLSDIQAFRQRFNLPANDPQVVLYGADPGTNSAQIEANLDLEWAGAVARNAHIVYVNSTNVLASAKYAIDNNLAPIMTFSYGYCEQDVAYLRSYAQQANAQGITWMASSGDAGAATCDQLYSPTPQASLGPTLSFPADLPEVTAVGGTQFNEGTGTYWAATNDANNASALGYIPEAVWNESVVRSSMVAGGGGPSKFFPKPDWQIGTPDDKVRDIPDISLSAGTHDPYSVIYNGSLVGVGGTSASSPSFAGLVAILNQYLVKPGQQPGLGNINPVLYRMAQTVPDVFHDTVTGDNTVPCVQGSPQCVNGSMGYPAAKSYDLATGLGTVDANRMVLEWDSGAASQTVLTASPATGDPSTPVVLTATVTGKGKALPTGTVQFCIGEIVVGTAALAPSADGASPTASVTVQAGLMASLQPYATYSGDTLYGSSWGGTSVTLNTQTGHSVVTLFAGPNPSPQSAGGTWPVTLYLHEIGGVATKITSAKFDTETLPLSYFSNGNLAANGSITASLVASISDLGTLPYTGIFAFAGQDADGTAWTQQIPVTFVAALGTYNLPAVGLTSTPTTVEQNAAADPSCAWKQDLTIDEHAGFLMQLTKLTVGTVDFTGQIQSIFGTTRLAPFGSLSGSLCWTTSNTVPGAKKTFTLTATAPNGLTSTATVTATYPAAASTTAAFSTSIGSVQLTVPDNQHNATASVDLTFSGATASWQAAVLPANATTSWLKVTPLSGSGSGRLTVQTDTSALSPGAYRATIAVSAPGSVPNYLSVPVILVVGTSTGEIDGMANAASYQPAFAPGMLAAVFGSGLASATTTARSIPLPLLASGVSATVNGIAAPVYGTYPAFGQLNIQIPYEAGSGPAVLAVNNNGAVSYLQFQIAAAAPGLFGVWDLTGKPTTTLQQGQTYVAYITGAGDMTPGLPTGATPSATASVKSLPKPRLPLALSIGGVDAGTPLFWGTPNGYVGVVQINFTVPATAPTGQQDFVVTVGGVASNAVSLNVTAPSK
jgi:uncharacterized protein (TIGR03437 family)